MLRSSPRSSVLTTDHHVLGDHFPDHPPKAFTTVSELRAHLIKYRHGCISPNPHHSRGAPHYAVLWAPGAGHSPHRARSRTGRRSCSPATRSCPFPAGGRAERAPGRPGLARRERLPARDPGCASGTPSAAPEALTRLLWQQALLPGLGPSIRPPHVHTGPPGTTHTTYRAGGGLSPTRLGPPAYGRDSGWVSQKEREHGGAGVGRKDRSRGAKTAVQGRR